MTRPDPRQPQMSKLERRTTLEQTIARICALQPEYSSSNTPAMQERGHLIRDELKSDIEDWVGNRAGSNGSEGRSWFVQASDGIGRKTEAPWVRVADRDLSPNPRTGYYLVVHFSRDGSAFWVTLGCGSTVWKDGDLKPLSDEKLEDKTGWARQAVAASPLGIGGLSDEIDLGARAKLPKTFEKATALAKRLRPGTPDPVVERYLEAALVRLEMLYELQTTGRDLYSSEAIDRTVTDEVEPAARTGQGFGLTAPQRRMVELRAMELAQNLLEDQGFDVVDTSASESFDFAATKGPTTYKVEVKGTTARDCLTVLMTTNEVELHKREKGFTALVTVSGIQLTATEKAIGGVANLHMPWNIDAASLRPISYKVVL